MRQASGLQLPHFNGVDHHSRRLAVVLLGLPGGVPGSARVPELEQCPVGRVAPGLGPRGLVGEVAISSANSHVQDDVELRAKGNVVVLVACACILLHLCT